VAKDALKQLEGVSDKFDRERRELIQKLDKEKDECVKREESKWEVKVRSLKALNEQLNNKLQGKEDTEEDLGQL